MVVLYYLLISAVLLVPSSGEKQGDTRPFPNNECRHESDFSNAKCVSRVFCYGKVYIPWDTNSFRESLNCPNTFVYSGRILSETYYAIKNVPDTVLLAGTVASNIITSLDLCYNDYTVAPILTTMERLQTLNLSRNALTEANLYNYYNLRQLSEIDLSHNMINSISVNRDQYVYGQLKKINLSNNKLVDLQDGIFDSFPKLEELDLSFNFIETLNILTFEGITKLTRLNFNQNKLSELGSSLLRFGKLAELYLGVNRLQSIASDDLEKLTELKILDLNSNYLTKLDKTIFNKMTKLQVLNLRNNLLENVADDMLANLTTLVNLDLSKNNLKCLPNKLFIDNQIGEFSASDNNLEGPLVKWTFKGLKLCNTLDLSNQKLTSIEDLAFDGLQDLKILLLNGNGLQMISQKSFYSLMRLEVLDLSNNLLKNFEFDKEDLTSLVSLLLQKNHVIQVTHELFSGLKSLQFLDLSSNNISQIKTKSFKSLKTLINLQIANNPISGALEENTFEGLSSLPSLDISGTQLTVINNGSFDKMTQMKVLNASCSKIIELHYNSFLNTGLIETIDLSFNKLSNFNINATELASLKVIFLNNNLLTIISSSFFKGLSHLTIINVSHNKLKFIDDDALKEQKDISILDLSHNQNLNLNLKQFETFQNLSSLNLSDIQTKITFKSVTEMKLTELVVSYSNVSNITSIGLHNLKSLENLVLTNNNITKVEASAFIKMKNLIELDLSFNKISFIQPGAFKENQLLRFLNISHNNLKALSYGVLKGLAYLNTLDMSYNEINDLQSERFYEVQSLRILIADHNNIENVNADAFSGTNLYKLSIGENPLPCHVLVNLRKNETKFAITAIRLNENNDDENVGGITCNMERSATKQKYESILNQSILMDMRNLLKNISAIFNNKDSFPFYNTTTKMNKNNAYISELLQNILLANTNANVLLDKMLKVLSDSNKAKEIDSIHVPNKALTDNKINDDLAYKESSTLTPNKEILKAAGRVGNNAYPSDDDFNSKLIILLEICVGLILILIILVAFILYFFYSSGALFSNKRSRIRSSLTNLTENSSL